MNSSRSPSSTFFGHDLVHGARPFERQDDPAQRRSCCAGDNAEGRKPDAPPRAGRRGGGPAGLRLDDLIGGLCAARHAEGDRAQAEPRLDRRRHFTRG